MKRQFKHVQSQDIVEEVLTTTGYYQSIKVPMANPVPGKYIENTNDWVEITKPEYTILSFKYKSHHKSWDGIWNLNGDKYESSAYKECTGYLNAFLKDSGYVIHSVRRESDSEIFTVDDNYNLGTIKSIELKDNTPIFHNGNGSSSGLKVTVKSKAKEWEITALSSPHGLIPLVGEYQISYCFKLSGYKITAVKRLSDNVEFKIGDKICGTQSINENKQIGPGYVIIKSFSINEQGFLETDHCTGTSCEEYGSFPKLKLFVKEKLFTTEDGVDIFEGNTFWFVNNIHNNLYILNEARAIKGTTTIVKTKDIPDFSTKEAAEEYILMNKPCLSLQDIHNASLGYIHSTSPYLTKLKELVKTKL